MFRYLSDKPAKAPRTSRHGDPVGFQKQDASETPDPYLTGHHHHDHEDVDANDQGDHGEIGDSEWL
jgi:hypothetical protein